jgi:Spy/CpxP family protein refolding chaperone
VKKIFLVLAAFGTLAAAAGRAPAQPGGFPGGPGGPPQPGQVLPGPVQERLNLTPEQRKQLEELQKDVDARLAKILTAEQKKALQDLQAGGGPGGFPGGFPGGPPPGGFVGFGGGFAAANRLEDVKKQLGATDEEWKVIGPKLQKVTAARQALLAGPGAGGPQFAMGGFGGPFGGGGRPGGGPPAGGSSVISQAQADLKTVLDDPKHTPAEVREKVAAVRKARQKARGDLDAAQKDLLEMLTAEQEAVLVSLGYLD